MRARRNRVLGGAPGRLRRPRGARLRVSSESLNAGSESLHRSVVIAAILPSQLREIGWDLANWFGPYPPTSTAWTRYLLSTRPIRRPPDWKGPVCPETWHGRSVRYVVNSDSPDSPANGGPSRACGKPIGELDPGFATWGQEPCLLLRTLVRWTTLPRNGHDSALTTLRLQS